MKIESTAIADVLVMQPQHFSDARGHFFESFNARRFNEAVGREVAFVQDNQSYSTRHVLRGLHYQIQQTQGKLVRVVQGEVLDVAVDLRRRSPTYGQWVSAVLSAENRKQLWVPEGFAHGFVVLSDTAVFLYKTTDYYAPAHERSIAWNDPALGIDWQLAGALPVVNAKDGAAPTLAAAAAAGDVFA
jgi:dTDP-4-dehydrorhamnose 3,5-epimerase